MNVSDFRELFDSAESLLGVIASFGHADEGTARSEIARLSSILNDLRSHVPDYVDIIGDSDRAKEAITLQTNIEETKADGRPSVEEQKPLGISLREVQAMYKSKHGFLCSDDNAKAIIIATTNMVNLRRPLWGQIMDQINIFSDNDFMALSNL